MPIHDLLIGVLLVLALLLKAGFERVGAPALVAFLILGAALGALDDGLGLISGHNSALLAFMADIGLIVLLFRVGLESNLHGLASKLAPATPIWLGNVVLSGLPGYLVAHHGLGFAPIPSLFVAVALTATSLAVSVGIWQEAQALDSDAGEILTDVAGLDDLSGIALMGLLLAVVPVLRAGDGGALAPLILETGGLFVLEFLAFAALCLLFARYAEGRIIGLLATARRPDPILVIIGVGIVIAALAAALGFSLAIGALLAGLVFSRDPRAVHMETDFLPIYEFFAPFFFIGVGMHIDLAALGPALPVAGALVLVAVAGKVLGAGLPALPILGRAGAVAVGVSMVPRAEIAMVVVQEGRRLGDWAVPDDLYAGMIVVSAVTCILSPLVVRALLRRCPPAGS